MCPLLINECSLSREPPSISTQLSASPHHAMTWNHERHIVTRAGPGYCPCSLRRSDPGGDFSVRLDCAIRNRLQIVPDTHLKRCRSDVERQIKIGLPACNELRE